MKDKCVGQDKLKKEAGVETKTELIKNNVHKKSAELTAKEQQRLSSFLVVAERIIEDELQKPFDIELKWADQAIDPNSNQGAFIFETVKCQKLKLKFDNFKVASLTTTWNNSHMIIGLFKQIRS